MLAAPRLYFLLTLLLVLAIGTSLPSAAQFQGVPPGQFQGVPTIPFQGVPSASFGHAYGASAGESFPGCCANFFLPPGFSPLVMTPSPAPEHHHHRHHRDDQTVVAEPVYIPYPVPYGGDADADAAENQDSAEAASAGSAPANRQVAAKGVSDKNSDNASEGDSGYDTGDDTGTSEVAPERPEEPVVAQPTTVLVFKDGHRSDVVNYAIVGDTLFDFAEGRAHKILLADLDLAATRKANDELGVEFKLPPAPK